jgi:hypothetical protein
MPSLILEHSYVLCIVCIGNSNCPPGVLYNCKMMQNGRRGELYMYCGTSVLPRCFCRAASIPQRAWFGRSALHTAPSYTFVGSYSELLFPTHQRRAARRRGDCSRRISKAPNEWAAFTRIEHSFRVCKSVGPTEIGQPEMRGATRPIADFHLQTYL